MRPREVGQRTIKIGECRSEYELDERRQSFEEALQRIIDDNNMHGVNCVVNRSPNRSNRNGDDHDVLVQLYAKVTWPPQGGSRVGVMELLDLMDDFNLGKQRQI